MSNRRRKDILIGFPGGATSLRVATPAGEVWIEWRQEGPAEGPSPSMVVSIDTDKIPPRPELHLKHADARNALIWVGAPRETTEP